MKKILLCVVILFALSPYAVHPASAQSETPPASPLGKIRGTVINHNSDKVVAESLEVMLHILNMDYVDMDMVHGQSQPDGSFVFADVPFAADRQFAVMTTFNGVTYFSDTVPADMKSLQLAIDVPVYESTKELATVQVDQMHVLFESSPDGLETKELYIISNSGARTVKDAYDLGEDKFGALKFPLPQDADYIFFDPDDKDRFVKQDGAFVDTYPLLPQSQLQVMVSYLIPYSGKRTYSYTPTLNIARMNFVIPEQAGISLAGTGLTGPEPMSLQDGKSYLVYSYSDLKVGQTLNISIIGTATTPASSSQTSKLYAIGAAFLGCLVIGMGVWWWRKSESTQLEQEQTSPQTEEATFDDVITEIALLDETYTEKGLSIEAYQARRKDLLQKAKSLS